VPYQTGIPYIDTLLSDLQPHWNGIGSSSSPAVVTYSFVEDKDVYNASTSPGIEAIDFSAFSAAQRDAARDAFNLWSSVANITFVEVADTGETHGDIRLLNSNDIIEEFGAAGLAFYPMIGQNEDRQSSDNEVAGDIVIAPASSGTQDFSEFGFGRLVLIHEIGHAIGLNHPNADDSLLQIPAGENNDRYTIMTTPETSASPNAFGNNIYATSPMLYDIAAIQHLYGANFSTNSGNTIYEFLSNDSQIKTIWDAGGIDTIDLSDQTIAAYLDLNPGSFSSIYPTPPYPYSSATVVKNIGIAYGVIIENAIGGTGADTIIGNASDNFLIGGYDDDLSGDILEGEDGNDLLTGGYGNDYIRGGDDNDVLYGDHGNDDLSGGSDNDVLHGGEGDDHLVGDSGNDYLEGDSGNDDIFGGLDDDVLNGGTGNDVLRGWTGNDVLDGGTGIDRMEGWFGDDTYIVDNSSDVVIETNISSGGGSDRIISSVSVSLPQYVENLSLTGENNISGAGNYLDNLITGNSGDNILYGHAGKNVISGGLGNDVINGGEENNLSRFIYGSSDDRNILKFSPDGTLVETIQNSNYFPSTGGVRDILVDDDSNVFIINGTFEPYLTIYDSGTSTFKHYSHPDWSYFGISYHGDIEKFGNYIYVNDYHLSAPGGVIRFDIINETFDRFADERDVYSQAVDINGFIYVVDENIRDKLFVYNPVTLAQEYSICLAASVDDVAIDDIGNIYGIDGDVVMQFDSSGALLKSVTIPFYIQFSTDIEISDNGYVLVGSTNGEVILLNNSLEIINNFQGVQFVAFGEQIDGGHASNDGDTATYKDAMNSVYVSLLSGVASGADGNDILIDIENIEGSGFDDVLEADSENNLIFGLGGNDLVKGGAGNDLVDGGDGNDTMLGGIGNDTYHVNTPQDTVVEHPGQGRDLILSSISYELIANVEDLTLLDGVSGINATGNASNNAISGNNNNNLLTGLAGNDILSGQGGNDNLLGGRGYDDLRGGLGNDYHDGGNDANLMTGGAGNDTYIVRRGDGDGVSRSGAAEDRVIELLNEGADTVESHVYSYALTANVENLVLAGAFALKGFGNGLNNVLVGNDRDNLLQGGEGNDELYGGAGRDNLSGGAGNDVLRGDAGIDILSGGIGQDVFVFNNLGSVDFVIDFTGGVDRLQLVGSLFQGIGLVGSAMSSSSFRSGTSPVAADADDHVLYNSQSGALFYDPDGNGTDVMLQFATLSGAPALVSSDIWVIA